jgi:serine phosphatase RsbU (regulator of sigma subunit)
MGRTTGDDDVLHLGNRVVAPAEVAYELNRRFPMEEQNGLYFTMVYGVLDLDTLEFRFVSAGHVPLVHVPRTGAPTLLDHDGVPIGWFDDVEYDDRVVKSQPGDRLYLYSDGVPESMNEEFNQFTTNQMLEIIELGKHQSLDDSVSLPSRAVERWCAKDGPKTTSRSWGWKFRMRTGLRGRFCIVANASVRDKWVRLTEFSFAAMN